LKIEFATITAGFLVLMALIALRIRVSTSTSNPARS
jgi:hypothetical protein